MSDPPVTVLSSGVEPSPPGCRVEFSGGITVVVSAPKSQRINLRVTAGDLAILRQAAALTGSTLTEFLLSTAVREAQSLLAESTVTSSKELS